MAYREDTNATLIITIGAVSGIVIVVLAVGLQAWFLYEESTETDAKWNGMVENRTDNLHKDQQANLEGYRWVDQKTQVVSIPIEQAMSQVVQNGGKLAK